MNLETRKLLHILENRLSHAWVCDTEGRMSDAGLARVWSEADAAREKLIDCIERHESKKETDLETNGPNQAQAED